MHWSIARIESCDLTWDNHEVPMYTVFGHVRLLVDIVSAKLLVWLFGRNGELLDSHLFFYDRYSELADYHRQRGRIAKAERSSVTSVVNPDLQEVAGADSMP